MKAAAGLAGGLVACAAASALGADLFAGQVTEANAAVRLVGGTDAIGGVGDWSLSNGTLCAIVNDPSHESDLMPQGGALVDLGHCGRSDDQFLVLHSLINLARDAFVPSETIRAEVEGGVASLRVEGGRGGLRLETTFALDRALPDRLRVVTRLERTAPGERAVALGDLVLHVDAALAPWAGALEQGQSRGFAHPDVELERVWSLVRAIRRSDLHVLVGPPYLHPQVAYAVRVSRAVHRTLDGTETDLPVWALQDATISTFAVLSGELWWGGEGDTLGLLELAQLPFLDLGVGESLTLEREIRMGRRADVASVLDPLRVGLPRISGRTEPAAVVRASRDGTPENFSRADSTGAFEMRVPAGTYELEIAAAGGRVLSRAGVEVSGDLDLGALDLPPPARVAWSAGTSARLVFEPVGETPEPRLRDPGTELRFGEHEAPESSRSADWVPLAGADEPATISVPAGRHRVYAVRGPEHGITATELEAVGGETATLALRAPDRVLETPGWIAADLHVHAAPSDDSALPVRDQALAFYAAAAEVIVATDHDHVTDYQPVLEELGLVGRLASVVGVEVTSNVSSDAAPHTIGHSNAFPLRYRPRAYRKGAPVHEGARLRDLVARVRAEPSSPLLQLNHPRADGQLKDNAYFTHLRTGEPFDPTLPLDATPNRSLVERDPETGLRDLDFDAMELLNGPSLDRYRSVRADWFSLLRQGEFRTATANSDSHRRSEIAAFPRSYVALEDDDPAHFDEAEFVTAVRRGRVWGTTGPLLSADLEGVGIGGTYRGSEGLVRVRVDAAPWVPVGELRVYRDGELVYASPIGRGETAVVPLQFERDGFVTVEVEGPAEGDYAAVLPGFAPFAFTNPIFVDADDDGVWTAPGL